MARAVEDTNGKGRATDIEALNEQIAALKTEMAHIAATGKETARIAARAARHEAGALVEKGEEQLSALKDQAGTLMGEAEAAVRRNPGMAVGAAIGLGFLIGVLSTRR